MLAMKKRFLSAALILLGLLLLLPGACADYIYPAPAAIPAGQAIDHLVATVASDSQVDGSLPEGLWLAVETQEDAANVFLQGTLFDAGVYDCIINIDNASFTCQITILPPAPVVMSSADLRCYPGEAVQVSVSAESPGGRLSYQWYRSLSSEETGEALDGATEDSLLVPTDQLGTLYYSCLVTSSVDGLSSFAHSTPIAVTVEELSVSAIAVEALPVRTEYALGDTLDTAGLTVRATLANGNTLLLDEGFGVYPTRLDTSGEQEIEISYQGQTCSFPVYVQQSGEIITGIGVLTLPEKTHYRVGDSLETRGLSIRVYTNEGYRDVSEGLDCSPLLFEEAGKQTDVSVSYGGKTCTFTVQVDGLPAGLSIARLPDKIQYAQGEALDTTGLIVRQVNSDGSMEDITSGFTCSPERLEALGHQEITVQYGDLSCLFHVTVIRAAAPVGEATPVPTPERTPALSPESLPTPTTESATEPAPESLPEPAPESAATPESAAAPTTEDTPAPTTTPTPSPSPAAPSPAPSAAPEARTSPSPQSPQDIPDTGSTPAPSAEVGNAKTLFVVVLIASLITLAALGAYVYITNRGGVTMALEAIQAFFRGSRGR